MRKFVYCFLSFIFIFWSIEALAQAVPFGYWKTVDDVTHKPKAIMLIKLSQQNQLTGQIVKIYPRPGSDQNERCDACVGIKHNQRIVGMVIMEGLKQNRDNPNIWQNGRILDPSIGKTYRCNITLSQDGQKLLIRGYLGIPLFGRSQTWIRVTNPL